jgi:hypothetical protein
LLERNGFGAGEGLAVGLDQTIGGLGMEHGKSEKELFLSLAYFILGQVGRITVLYAK